MLIALTNKKAARLLHELEELHLIKVLQEDGVPTKSEGQTTKLSTKYRGSISQEQGQQLNEHIQEMRSEWSDT